MRRYATEFIGTFFLVFTVCTGVRSGSPYTGLAAGAVLMVMVFAGGHISGGHYNPAVTLAVFLRGKLAANEVGPYWGSQILAGVAAAGLSRFVAPGKVAAMDLTGRHLWAAFVVELLFTFALAYVVLNVATSKDHPNNHFYGLAIGFTVAAGALAAGSVSGGAFNPAVGLGACIAGLASWSMVWVYLIATLLGGAAAAYTFKFLNPDDTSTVESKPAAAPAKASKTVPASRRSS